ncbi:MAG: FkbM family methyltransferase [Acetobacteraceae bacterium]|nr:FkbM family methyltransferase [Acetobacteraceae bacterium]
MQEIDFHRAMHRPGTIVDAGAHEGRLTLPLAALPGTHVIAFEPLPPAFARLRQAVSGLGGRVTPRPEALSDRAGSVTLTVPRVGGVAQEEWASIAKDYTGIMRDDPRVEAIDTWIVPSVTLDSLGLTGVTAIKIDVEGAEEEVLRGALNLLRLCRPVLSVEIEERHRAGSTRAIPDLLRPLGYTGYFEFYGDWRPIETLDIETMQKGSPSPAAFEVSHPYVFGFYFVPPERVADLAVLARLP